MYKHICFHHRNNHISIISKLTKHNKKKLDFSSNQSSNLAKNSSFNLIGRYFIIIVLI